MIVVEQADPAYPEDHCAWWKGAALPVDPEFSQKTARPVFGILLVRPTGLTFRLVHPDPETPATATTEPTISCV